MRSDAASGSIIDQPFTLCDGMALKALTMLVFKEIVAIDLAGLHHLVLEADRIARAGDLPGSLVLEAVVVSSVGAIEIWLTLVVARS